MIKFLYFQGDLLIKQRINAVDCCYVFRILICLRHISSMAAFFFNVSGYVSKVRVDLGLGRV
jgi:hypothetical protein